MSGAAPMEVRNYHPADPPLPGLLHDARQFRWRQVDHPEAVASPRVVVALDHGRVAGMASAQRQALVFDGVKTDGALLGPRQSTGQESLDRGLLELLSTRLADEGAAVLLAAIEPAELPFFEAAGFRYLGEAAARNLYIGLEAVSARLSKTALSPLRRFAQEARRIRPKLVEVELDSILSEIFSRLSTEGDRQGLALFKSPAYWTWRYKDDPHHHHRTLVYRQKAGGPIDAFAIVRRHDSDRGRAVLHLMDYWTRQPGRRAHAKLLGDLAILAMTEGIDVLRCFAVAGSSTEQAMLGLGCIRKKVERVLVLRRLDPESVELPSPYPAKDAGLVAGDLDLYDVL